MFFLFFSLNLSFLFLLFLLSFFIFFLSLFFLSFLFLSLYLFIYFLPFFFSSLPFHFLAFSFLFSFFYSFFVINSAVAPYFSMYGSGMPSEVKMMTFVCSCLIVHSPYLSKQLKEESHGRVVFWNPIEAHTVKASS